MSPKNKSWEDPAASMNPFQKLFPARGPVLIYDPRTKRTGGEPMRTEIKCKIGESGKLLIKFRPGEEWYEFDCLQASHSAILEEVVVCFMLANGVIFDYSDNARK